MQSGVESERLKIVNTENHCIGYDLKIYDNRSRLGYDTQIVTRQDLAEFYVSYFLSNPAQQGISARPASQISETYAYHLANPFALKAQR